MLRSAPPYTVGGDPNAGIPMGFNPVNPGVAGLAVPPFGATLRVQRWNFRDVWDDLRTNVIAILDDPTKPPPKPFPSLDRMVHKLTTSDVCVNIPRPKRIDEYVSSNHAAQDPTLVRSLTLHLLLQEVLSEFVHSVVLPRITTERAPSDNIVGAYVVQFERFSCAMRLVAVIFRYLRSQWQRLRAPVFVHDTVSVGLVAWRDNLFLPLHRELMAALHLMVEGDRLGTIQLNRVLVRSALKSLVTMNQSEQKGPTALYQRLFEEPFLAASEQWFARRLASARGVPWSNYMISVEREVRTEIRRAADCFDRNTVVLLKRVLMATFVEPHVPQLLKQCDEWIDTGASDDLRRLFWLLHQSECGVEPLRKCLEDRIDAEGRAAVARLVTPENANDAALLVRLFISIYSKYATIVRQIFDGHRHLLLALEKGARRFINRGATVPPNSARAADFVARYCHLVLLPGRPQDEPLEMAVPPLLTIFSLLEDRDYFQSLYGHRLATRLIYGTYDADAEAFVIQRFKETAGHEFTYKWQRMFNDATVNVKSVADSFEAFVREQSAAAGLPLESPTTPLAPGLPSETAASPRTVALLVAATPTTPTPTGASTAAATLGNSSSNASPLSPGTPVTGAGSPSLTAIQPATLALLHRFQPMVLMSGAWPIGAASMGPPLAAMQPAVRLFEAFYRQAWPQRRLQWLAEFSHGVLRSLIPTGNAGAGGNGAKRVYEFVVSQQQAAVLLDLDEGTAPWASGAAPGTPTGGEENSGALPSALPFSALKTAAPSEEVLSRALLLLARARVISVFAAPAAPESGTRTAPMAPGSVPSDAEGQRTLRFALNANFSNSNRKVNLLNNREGGGGGAGGTDDAVAAAPLVDRRFAIQAALVRVMKARKALRHKQLLAEAVAQLQTRFTPSMQDLKTSIDSLLEKEYLVRDDKDSDLLHYAA